MVLENIVSEKMLEKHFSYALMLGAGYSLIGMILASFIFGANSGIVGVMFTSLLLAPSMMVLFEREEQQEEQEKHFSIKRLIINNKHVLTTYLGVFLGVFATYFLASMILPFLGVTISTLFREQLILDPALAGRATFNVATFTGILANNWLVLVVTFLLALLIGDGAVFFVAWNASAWGTIFGYRVFAASQVSSEAILVIALTLLAIVAWHTILEGGAYILAAMSGAAISSAVIKQTDELHTFLGYAAALTVIYVLAYRLISITNHSLLILIPLLLLMLYGLSYAFTNKKHHEVFIYNYWLFVIAIAVFIIGVLVETLVLTNSSNLQLIYMQATMLP